MPKKQASTHAGKPEKNEAAMGGSSGGIAYFFLDFFGTFFVKKKSGRGKNKKKKLCHKAAQRFLRSSQRSRCYVVLEGAKQNHVVVKLGQIGFEG